MPGPSPKPISRQIAEGDTKKVGVRKLRERLEAEPKAARGFPKPPAHLQGLALEIWNFWTEELAAMSLDHRPDAVMLEGACVNYARAVQSDELLRDGCQVDEPIFNKNGEEVGSRIKNHPAVSVSNACWKQVRGFCGEFGLSPASRTRLTLDKRDDTEDELMQLLSSPRKPRAEKVQ